jgi:hypothetical protein
VRLIEPRLRPPVEKVRQDESLVVGEANDHLIRQGLIGLHVRHHSLSVPQEHPDMSRFVRPNVEHQLKVAIVRSTD